MNFDYDNIFIDDNDNCDLTIFQGKTKSHQQEQQETMERNESTTKRFRLNKENNNKNTNMEYNYDYDLANEMDNEITKQKNIPPLSEITSSYQELAYNTLRNALTRSPLLSPSTSSTSSSLSSSPSRQTTTASNYILIDNDFYKNFENLLNAKPLNKMFKYDLNDSLNLTRKDTLTFLIERNISNGILAPFDQYAYSKLTKSTNNQIKFSDVIEDKHAYNYYNIRKISKLMRTYNNNNLDDMKRFLKHNNLMPSCVSALLMPFFFDVFSMSELKLFGDETVKIMLSLKKYHKAQVYLDEFTLISCVSENIVWNCLALFKLKQQKQQQKFNSMYYFNFYLTYFYLQTYLHQMFRIHNNNNNQEMIKEEIKRSLNIGFILPHLLDALIMTGVFSYNDYLKFKEFFQEKQRFDHSLEQAYLENSMKNVTQTAENCFPLKLKNLCRIEIRKNLINYDSNTFNQLTLPESMKKFLMYNEDLELIYFKKSRLFK